MKKREIILNRILLGFVIFSLGYLWGKYQQPNQTDNILFPKGSYLAVYYAHTTFRCQTCDKIEELTKDLLNEEFAPQLKSHKMYWKSIDFQENPSFAEKFEITASSIVLIRLKDGNPIDFKRLDKGWELINSPKEFQVYVKKAIHDYIKEKVQ